MLRIYFMQQWFKLPDPATDDALFDREWTRRFAGIDLAAGLHPVAVPGAAQQHRLGADDACLGERAPDATAADAAAGQVLPLRGRSA
jgi:hypothetical protein